MKKINVLRICYWCLLVIACFMLSTVFSKWTIKDFVMPTVIMLCCMVAGYIDRIIDEEKEK